MPLQPIVTPITLHAAADRVSSPPEVHRLVGGKQLMSISSASQLEISNMALSNIDHSRLAGVSIVVKEMYYNWRSVLLGQSVPHGPEYGTVRSWSLSDY